MQKRYILVSVFLSFPALNGTSSLLPITLEETHKLTQLKKPAIVVKALAEEARFRQENQKALAQLQDRVWNHIKRLSTQEIAELYQNITRRLENDRMVIEQVQPELKADNATYSFKTHKMRLILEATQTLLAQEWDSLDGASFICNEVPQNWFMRYDTPHVISNPLMDGGDIQSLAIKTLYIYALIELEGGPISTIRDFGNYAEKCPFVHTTPLPPKSDLLRKFPQFTFFYESKDGSQQGELAFVHGGYAFGGQRQDSRTCRIMGPEDCSSWIAHIIGSDEEWDTGQLTAFYNDFLGEGYPLATYKRSNFEHLTPYKTKNGEGIRAGDVFAFRTFSPADPNHDQSLGQSGHVMLILEASTQAVTVLDRTRDLPEKEGFGIRKLDFLAFAQDANKKVMLFHTDNL